MEDQCHQIFSSRVLFIHVGSFLSSPASWVARQNKLPEQDFQIETSSRRSRIYSLDSSSGSAPSVCLAILPPLPMPVRADQHDARHGATSPDSGQLSNRKPPTSLTQVPVASPGPHERSRSTNPIVRPNVSMLPRPGGSNCDLEVGMSSLKLHVRRGWGCATSTRLVIGCLDAVRAARVEARAHLSDVSSPGKKR